MKTKIAPVFLALLLTYASPCAADNTAYGTAAGADISTGTNNTIVGTEAGVAVTTGTDNTLLGYESGYGVTGSHNIILGEDPSSAITTGSSNILVGNSITEVTNSSSSQLDIGDTLYGTLGGSGTITAANNFTALGTIIGNLFSGSGASLTNLNGSNISSGTVSAARLPVGTVITSTASPAQGDILYYNGSNWIDLAAGTSGYFLKTQGTGANPEWAVAGNGTVNSGTQYQLGYYASTGTAISGDSSIVTDSSGDLSLGSGSYQLNAHTVLTFPDADTTSIAVGKSALTSQSSTSLNNTAVGDTALDSMTTGTDSAAVGSAALYSATGSPNTAIGYEAGYYVTSGSDNIAIGYDAMVGASAHPLTGANAGNVAIGDNALTAITGGATGNVAVGYNALTSSTVSSTNPNTAVGDTALENATTGSNNTAIGNLAMTGTSAHPMTGAGYNVAVGDSSLTAISGSAADSTAIGYAALGQATGGPNTTLGYKAGYAVTTGTDNTLVGYESGLGITGSHNIILGEDPSSAITTGSSNILIGNSLTEVTNTTSSQLDIGDTIYGTLGGSGLITFANNIALANSTAHQVLVAEGTSAVAGVSPSTSGYVLTSNGTGSDPSFQAAPAPSNNAIASAASGFVNKFRNGNMLASQRMAANTSTSLTTTDAYWIDGWEYHVTGGTVTGYWQNTAFTATSGNNPAYLPGYMEIKGAASNTAIDIYQKIESFDASALAGQAVTVQFQFYNDSGATITPTVQSCYASAQDNFATCTSDLSASNMQACSNGSTCIEAYSFTPSTNATKGYEVKFAFGAMTSSSDIIEMSGFDIRVTPGVTAGTVSGPPVIEQPTSAAELARDYRYFECTYGNGVATATSTAAGLAFSNSTWAATTGAIVSGYIKFSVPKRASPTITYWDKAGNSSKFSTYNDNSDSSDNAGALSWVTGSTTGLTWGYSFGSGSAFAAEQSNQTANQFCASAEL